MRPVTINNQPAAVAMERRRHRRFPVGMEGRILHAGGEAPCAVIDFSPGGARIRTQHDFPLGASISLKLTETGEFAGRIAWAAGELIGVHFGHLPDR